MRIFRILALILVLAVLVCGVLYVMHLEREDNDRMLALYTEAEPLERQREERYRIVRRKSARSSPAFRFHSALGWNRAPISSSR